MWLAEVLTQIRFDGAEALYFTRPQLDAIIVFMNVVWASDFDGSTWVWRDWLAVCRNYIGKISCHNQIASFLAPA